jgi:tetratricopeptide (TPR) repeat protein
LKRVARRVGTVISTLFCFALLSLPAIATGGGYTLDPRIIEADGYRMLVQPEPWELGDEYVNDWWQQLRECTGSSMVRGSRGAHRAYNLAATRHFSRAIEEWTKAIDYYAPDGTCADHSDLSPSWLLNRARLHIELNQREQALADILRALKMKTVNEGSKFKAALFFMRLGYYNRAEDLLSTTEPEFKNCKRFYLQLLGVAQLKQNKLQLAKKSFIDAATLFAAAGSEEAVESCFDSVRDIDGGSNDTDYLSKFATLRLPRSNYVAIVKLLTALATNPDVLKPDLLQSLTGVDSFQETNRFIVGRHSVGKFDEIKQVVVEKIPAGGNCLMLRIDTSLCSINTSAVKDLLQHPVSVEEKWQPEIMRTEAYSVPAGTLVLGIRNRGFKSITMVYLYSKDVLSINNTRPEFVINFDAMNPIEIEYIDRAITIGDFKYAENQLSRWLQSRPEDAQANRLQADLLFKKGDTNGALSTIETAIKFSGNKKTDFQYSGNIYLIRKGAYLLKQEKYNEALSLFARAFPTKLNADHLLLRAQAEIGLGQKSKAITDLENASKELYEHGRIIKWDETEKLLASLK